MGCKLDFAWLSDPLLQYALYLSGIFFTGILACIGLISYKFQSYKRHQVNETQLIHLLESHLSEKQIRQNCIDELNMHIHKCPIDSCYAIVRVMENYPTSAHSQLKGLDLEYAIDQALGSRFQKNQAIAIEAIGLLQLQSHRAKILLYLEDLQFSSFAAEAFIRIEGLAGIGVILDCYKKGLLSISQILTAIVQLSPMDLKALLLPNSSVEVPTELMQYLKPYESN